MQTFADYVRSLSGWRRSLAASACGAISVLAMAPFFAWPVLFLTLPVLVWMIDVSVVAGPAWPAVTARARWWHSGPGRAARAGWWFGFGYFFAGLFWIGEAFLVEAEKFAVLIPLAVTLMPAGLALFWAGAAGLAALAWAPGWIRVVTLALAVAGAEWLRGHVFTGFPWNVLGYALTWPLPMMQSAAILGIYGLTLVAVPVLAAPGVMWVDALEHGGGKQRGLGLLFAIVAVCVLALLGVYRLGTDDASPRNDVRIRVVQPSVPQREKWRPENQERIFRDHLELSAQSSSGVADGAAGVALIVWPEAAMPFLPLNTPAALEAIGRLLPQGTHLAAGALRVEAPPGGSGRTRRIFNSLMIFGDEGRLAALYDKIHLVPFGEYLPFQAALEAIGLEQLTQVRGGFDAGTTPRPLLEASGLRILPLICYEAIFPSELVQGAERPALMLNVTNDGWFGQTTGPHQHLHQARVRAVEEGIPIVRAANNGISAVVDARGRIIGSLALDVRGTIDSTVPRAITPPPYARYGDWVFLSLFAAIGGALVLKRRLPKS